MYIHGRLFPIFLGQFSYVGFLFHSYSRPDIVRAVLPKGKFAGTHRGRITTRKTGVFELRPGDAPKVSPVNHKYCKVLHRNDGYSYHLEAKQFTKW